MGMKDIWFTLIAVFEFAAIGLAFCKVRNSKIRWLPSPRVLTMGGTFLTAVMLFMAVEHYSQMNREVIVQLAISLHNAIRIFVVDLGPLDYLYDPEAYKSVGTVAELIDNGALLSFVGFLFVLAPCLTFDLVLSFFGNTYAYLKLIFRFFKEKCIFTELNERSICLAESIYEKDCRKDFKERRAIVFNNVKAEGGAGDQALIERAKAIGAIVFAKNEMAVNYRWTTGKLSFFVMGQEHENNVKTADRIRSKYGKFENTTMYIFSSSVVSELFACPKTDEQIEIRRINQPRSLIYRTLYDMEADRKESGTPDLFALAAEEGGVKRISAVIVGLGEYGEEMLKALTWFCQMDGYKVRIDVFTEEQEAENRLNAKYPELLMMSSADTDDPGESQYEIVVHSDIKVESVEFVEQVKALKDVTYAFVALDSDEANVAAAVFLRRLFEQRGIKPLIHAALYNSDKAKMLDGCRNYKDQEYDIRCIGDLKTLYSDPVIIDSELEKRAFEFHEGYEKVKVKDFEQLPELKKNAKRKEWRRNFYMLEYNYSSSMARALHDAAREACGLQNEEGSEEKEELLKTLEHRRWNTYMRTEGYSYSSVRNDLAKQHHLLVHSSRLSKEEIDKDRSVPLG